MKERFNKMMNKIKSQLSTHVRQPFDKNMEKFKTKFTNLMEKIDPEHM